MYEIYVYLLPQSILLGEFDVHLVAYGFLFLPKFMHLIKMSYQSPFQVPNNRVQSISQTRLLMLAGPAHTT